MRRRLLLRLSLSGSLLLAPLPAMALEGAPDLVRTKDGGLLRGTIVEMVPGQKVTIALLGGEVRTLSMDTVTYAGPADEAPKPEAARAGADREVDEPKPMVTVRTEEARLQLKAGDTPLTWHTSALSGLAYGPGGMAVAQTFDRLCTAPCEVDIPVGSHRFALSADGGIPISTLMPTQISGDGELVGTFEDNSTARAVILTLSIAAVIGGGLLMLSPLLEEESDDSLDDDYDSSLGTGFYVGMGLMIGSPLLILFSPADRATVEYRPR